MYRTIKEIKYFGSDFNKFLNKLTKEMTVINIDCLQFKRSKNRLRIIEYKHSYENTPPRSQLEVLRILAKLLAVSKFTKVEVCIVKGDPPFDEIEIEDLINHTRFKLNGGDVKKWCEFQDIEEVTQ